jgi:hypothetical protein
MRHRNQDCFNGMVDQWPVRVVMQLQQPFAISLGKSGFSYQSPISINAAQVPSTQTDFPVLVSLTDARFKTVANSGHVQNSSGFDIRPYSDSGITTAITGYELERYNASTGEVIMWVKVGSLSSSTTPIYLAYGNPTISTDGSSTATWSNSFLSVYHLKDGTTLSLTDSVGTTNLTNTGSTAATGQIDGCASFVSASSQFLITGSESLGTSLTLSSWVKATTLGTDYGPIMTQASAGVDSGSIFVKSNGKLYCAVLASTQRSYDGTGSHTLTTGTWYYLTMTYSSAAGLIGYVNAASDGTASANGNFSALSNQTGIGKQLLGGTRFWNGLIDEPRIATASRSPDWISTEYNNQLAPATFQTLGTEVPL